MASSGSAMVGRDFGGYQVLREVGVGGMGIVYLAEHRLLGRRAAIKTIRAEIANDRSFSRRFLLEARAVAALNHPSIVRLYDFAFEEDTPYMVMEYVTGQSLEDALAGGRKLDARALLELLAPVGAALDHAHKQGVVHRDVKPANVLLADDGRTLIMDFGLASLAGFTMVSDPEAFMGTPDYIAPEQVAGQPVDGRADVYSLAAVIYEAVTGDRPWIGRTWMEIARRRLTEPPPLASGVPPEFAAALVRGMARQPEQRPRTPSMLLDSLSRGLDLASEPPPQAADRPVAVVQPAAPLAASPAPSQAPWPATPSLPVSTQPQIASIAVETATLSTSTDAPVVAASPEPSRSAPLAVTQPRLHVVTAAGPAVKDHAQPSAMAQLPLVSMVVVAAIIGVVLSLVWVSYLHDPILSLIRAATGG